MKNFTDQPRLSQGHLRFRVFHNRSDTIRIPCPCNLSSMPMYFISMPMHFLSGLFLGLLLSELACVRINDFQANATICSPIICLLLLFLYNQNKPLSQKTNDVSSTKFHFMIIRLNDILSNDLQVLHSLLHHRVRNFPHRQQNTQDVFLLIGILP